MTEFKTVALRVIVSFDGLTAGDVIHVPEPLDAYHQARMDLGLLAPAHPDGDTHGTVLSVDERGEETTVLGVMAPPRKRRRRSEEAEVEKMAPDGEADSE